ncbi:MAG: hypothetical protein HGA49_02310 [Eubacteriaceae bacterium]|nr:hypothetical protein [Eubacteriaceae bacterium]
MLDICKFDDNEFCNYEKECSDCPDYINYFSKLEEGNKEIVPDEIVPDEEELDIIDDYEYEVHEKKLEFDKWLKKDSGEDD